MREKRKQRGQQKEDEKRQEGNCRISEAREETICHLQGIAQEGQTAGNKKRKNEIRAKQNEN